MCVCVCVCVRERERERERERGETDREKGGGGEAGRIMDHIKTGHLMLNFTVTLTTLTSVLLV